MSSKDVPTHLRYYRDDGNRLYFFDCACQDHELARYPSDCGGTRPAVDVLVLRIQRRSKLLLLWNSRTDEREDQSSSCVLFSHFIRNKDKAAGNLHNLLTSIQRYSEGIHSEQWHSSSGSGEVIQALCQAVWEKGVPTWTLPLNEYRTENIRYSNIKWLFGLHHHAGWLYHQGPCLGVTHPEEKDPKIESNSISFGL